MELLSPKQMENITDLVLRVSLTARMNDQINETELQAIQQYCITAVAANHCYNDLMKKLIELRDKINK